MCSELIEAVQNFSICKTMLILLSIFYLKYLNITFSSDSYQVNKNCSSSNHRYSIEFIINGPKRSQTIFNNFLKVFPNPGTDFVNVKLPSMFVIENIYAYDIYGRQLHLI